MRPRVDRVHEQEGGWVLLASIAVMAIVLTIGGAVLSMADTQTDGARQQRTRESAFNVAEAALNAQIFSLARDWPGGGQAATPYTPCSEGVATARCPSGGDVTGLLPTADVAGATWATQVRDNGATNGAQFYSDSLVQSQPGYDANRDGQVWVRATATAKGKTRTVVALVRAEQQQEDIPHGALITGRLDISNMGNKIIIDAGAGGGSPTAIVRCTPQVGEGTSCLGHPVGQGVIKTVPDLYSYLGRQLSPNTVQTAYTGGDAMTPEARARLKATAIADGTYYTTCPPTLTGGVVYIEGVTGTCTYVGNSTFNAAGAPGMVLMTSGTLYLGGTTTFYGVLYHANASDSAGTAINLQGNTTVVGGILVDGPGLTIAGSSKLNLQLDPSAFNAVRSYGSAGIVQNTWRELFGAR